MIVMSNSNFRVVAKDSLSRSSGVVLETHSTYTSTRNLGTSILKKSNRSTVGDGDTGRFHCFSFPYWSKMASDSESNNGMNEDEPPLEGYER